MTPCPVQRNRCLNAWRQSSSTNYAINGCNWLKRPERACRKWRQRKLVEGCELTCGLCTPEAARSAGAAAVNSMEVPPPAMEEAPCVAFRATGICGASGEAADLGCGDTVPSDLAGYCECSPELPRVGEVACATGRSPFDCASVCLDGGGATFGGSRGGHGAFVYRRWRAQVGALVAALTGGILVQELWALCFALRFGCGAQKAEGEVQAHNQARGSQNDTFDAYKLSWQLCTKFCAGLVRGRFRVRRHLHVVDAKHQHQWVHRYVY